MTKDINEAVQAALKGSGDKVKQGLIDAKVAEELGRRQSIFGGAFGKLVQLEQASKRMQPAITGYQAGDNGKADKNKPIKVWTPELEKQDRELGETIKTLTEKLEKALKDDASTDDWNKLKEVTDKAQVPNQKGAAAPPAVEENKAA